MRRIACSVVLLLIPLVARCQELKFIDVPVLTQRLPESSFLADIVNRCRNPVLDEQRPTNGHESTHMLNSQLRNQHGGKVNALYVMSGKAVLLKEPRLRKSAVPAFVPPSLRGYRFRTYVTGAQEWDDTPTYLLDEWSAYVNGCFVALDDKRSGRTVEAADWAGGPLELGIYSLAMGMAVEQGDPVYFRDEPQFKAFLRWHWARAKLAFDRGRTVFPFQQQENLLKALQSSPDASSMRAFITKNLDGVWLK
jgi:hypothetical protein